MYSSKRCALLPVRMKHFVSKMDFFARKLNIAPVPGQRQWSLPQIVRCLSVAPPLRPLLLPLLHHYWLSSVYMLSYVSANEIAGTDNHSNLCSNNSKTWLLYHSLHTEKILSNIIKGKCQNAKFFLFTALSSRNLA